MDLDLRKLRYFLAVAEELNFGRAATRLHITQPVLSRQIRALEGELHVQLLLRDGHQTELTAAGELLQAEGALLVSVADALHDRLVRAGCGAITFTVGFMPGLTVTAPVRALKTAHPDVAVEVLRTTWIDQVSVLHDGQADVGYIRMPIDTTGLQTRRLFSERRGASLPASHPLANREGVNLRDLAGETMLQHRDGIPEWWQLPNHDPTDQPSPTGVQFNSVEEKLEAIAGGRGISVLPESTANYYHRPDIAWVPITDIPLNEVRLAWATSRRSALITEFADIAYGHIASVASTANEQSSRTATHQSSPSP
jgi:DNA-binding transcriptional LysR family regulator